MATPAQEEPSAEQKLHVAVNLVEECSETEPGAERALMAVQQLAQDSQQLAAEPQRLQPPQPLHQPLG